MRLPKALSLYTKALSCVHQERYVRASQSCTHVCLAHPALSWATELLCRGRKSSYVMGDRAPLSWATELSFVASSVTTEFLPILANGIPKGSPLLALPIGEPQSVPCTEDYHPCEGPTLITRTSLYLVPDRHYLNVLPLGHNHSTQ